MSTVSVQLPDDVVTRLNVLASRSGRSTEFYVAEPVLKHLGDLGSSSSDLRTSGPPAVPNRLPSRT